MVESKEAPKPTPQVQMPQGMLLTLQDENGNQIAQTIVTGRKVSEKVPLLGYSGVTEFADQSGLKVRMHINISVQAIDERSDSESDGT